MRRGAQSLAMLAVPLLAACSDQLKQAPMSLKDDVAACIERNGIGVRGACGGAQSCPRSAAIETVAGVMRDIGTDGVRGGVVDGGLDVWGLKGKMGWSIWDRITSPCTDAGYSLAVHISGTESRKSNGTVGPRSFVSIEVCRVAKCDPKEAGGMSQIRRTAIRDREEATVMAELAERVLVQVTGVKE